MERLKKRKTRTGMRKMLLALLAMLFVAGGALSCPSGRVQAAEDDFTYSYFDDVMLVFRYKGTSKDVVLEKYTPWGTPVQGISSYAFDECDVKLNSITLSSEVTVYPNNFTVLKPECCDTLMRIDVDKYNPYFSSEDGILYNKDKTELLICPRGKTGVVKIPDTVTSVAEAAFRDCSGLDEIIFPEGLKTIGDWAFDGCSGLESLNIPEGVTSIGKYAFDGVGSGGSLQYVNLPKSLEDLERDVFLFNEPEYVYFSGTAAQWNKFDIAKRDGLKDSTVYTDIAYRDFTYEAAGNGAIRLTGYTGEGQNLVIPKSLEMKDVTEVKEGLFSGREEIRSVKIYEGLEKIGENAFQGCGNLKDVYYTGGPLSWRKIEVGRGNECLMEAELHLDKTYPNGSTYTVRFDSGKGSKVPDQEVPEYGLVEKPEDPELPGQAFLGWYNGNEKWDFAYYNKVEKNMTLTAKWGGYYKVSFIVPGFDPLPTQAVPEEGLVKEPEAPKRAGYQVEGWYDGDRKWDFATDQVTGDITLTASWEETDKVSVLPNGTMLDLTTHPASTMLAIGESLTLDDFFSSGENGYQRTEWSSSNQNIIKTSSTVGTSITITARSAGKCEVSSFTVNKYYFNKTKSTHYYRVVTPIGDIDMDEEMHMEKGTTRYVRCDHDGEGNYSRMISGLKFASSREDVVTIDETTGLMEAVGVGESEITAFTNDPDVTGSCTVTVGEAVKTDFSHLAETVWKVADLKKDDYKDFSKVQEAMDAIEAMDVDNVSQAEVDAAAKRLQDAIDALEKVDAPAPSGKATAVVGKDGSISCYVDGKADPGYTGMAADTAGRRYWFDSGVAARSKEVYDPGTGSWHWFDADGTMAVDKDVYQLSYAGPYADNPDGTGKWVRYNEKGEMIKGQDNRYGGLYRFDQETGAMVKGWYRDEKGSLYYYSWQNGQAALGECEVDGVPCYFDPESGAAADCTWITLGGAEYWYESGKRQGLEGRGKEIYDPASDGWYWLDSVDQGKKAVSKDVYQESFSAYPDREDNTGKWVRYDANGRMIKGWQDTDAGTYYFEEVTGSMAKGNVVIGGTSYYFDVNTGILQ